MVYSASNNHKHFPAVSDCINHISSKYLVSLTGTPGINEFTLLNSKKNARLVKAWNIQEEKNSFTLCLVKYDLSYSATSSIGGRTIHDSHFYFYGYVPLKRDAGSSLIRPETILDKISDVFNPIDIDIQSFPKFNYKYFAIARDIEKFRDILSNNLLKFIESESGLQIEFQNKKCLFRLEKSADKLETMELCRIGLMLRRLLDH